MACLLAGTRFTKSLVLFGGWQAACRIDCYKIHQDLVPVQWNEHLHPLMLSWIYFKPSSHSDNDNYLLSQSDLL
jgi:hypothetical protein